MQLQPVHRKNFRMSVQLLQIKELKREREGQIEKNKQAGRRNKAFVLKYVYLLFIVFISGFRFS